MEIAILDFIQNNLRNPLLDAVVPLITSLGNSGFIWIMLTIIMLLMKRTRKTGFYMALSLIFSLVVCNLALKPLVARIRPFDVNKNISLIIDKPHDFSFPSGHTSASFAAATALLLGNLKITDGKKIILNKKLVIPVIILAILISLSRLYLYVHYPTDVLAAAILGVLFAAFSKIIIDKIYKNSKNRKEI